MYIFKRRGNKWAFVIEAPTLVFIIPNEIYRAYQLFLRVKMWKVTTVFSLFIYSVSTYPHCDNEIIINNHSGCPYYEIKPAQLCQLDSYNGYSLYVQNLDATSELIFISKKTGHHVKVEIPTTGSFELQLHWDKILINGEIKASIDKKDGYFQNLKPGQFNISPDRCLLNPDQEIEACKLTKNGTQYQVDSKHLCQLLIVFRNENLNLTWEDGNPFLAISYWKRNKLKEFKIGTFSSSGVLIFDWLKNTFHSNDFSYRRKPFPKNVDEFIILTQEKFKFSQSPSRDEFFSSRGWLLSSKGLPSRNLGSRLVFFSVYPINFI